MTKTTSTTTKSIDSSDSSDSSDSTIVSHEVTTPPVPGERVAKSEVLTLDTSSTPVFNKETVLYILYLQYRANMITRQHLKSYFAIINAPHPEDIAKYLVTEAAR